MFCIECGQPLPEEAKFCSQCGTKVSTSPPAPLSTPTRTDEPPESLVESALSSDAETRERAQRAIIDAVDVRTMQECAQLALARQDGDSANFWYLEWVTAPGISAHEASQAIFEYSEKVLVPQKRFSEAEFYLSWIVRCADPDQVEQATAQLQTLHRTRGAYSFKRFRCGNEWQSVDVSLPLDPNWSGEMQHRRTIAWLEARSEQGDLDIMANPWNPQHLSYVAGFLIGLSNNARKTGSDLEAQVQGFTDWIELRVNQALAEEAKIVAAAERAARPKPPPQAKAPKPMPKENALGKHIDELFGNEKMRAAVKSALQATIGVNDDYVVAAIPVTSKLGDGEDIDNYMIFTRDRAAIVKKGGIFSSGESESFTKKMIDYIGVGDSDHYEGQGFGGRTTNWISITIQLRQGLSYTRHYFLGRNEKQINSNLPYIRSAFERLGNAGYDIDQGPAWTSSGGYHTSFSYGFGVWR